jgi:hypothetical protein
MSAYKFRILLDTEKDSEIFRDILIDVNDNFENFYNAIISSFRFEGNQMASFYISNNDWDKGHEISLMDMNYGDESIDEKASVMSNANIKDFIESDNQKIILVYDFLKMWIFLIELIEIKQDTIFLPEVVLAIGIAPPEDSKLSDIELEDDSFIHEEEYIDDEDKDDDDFGLNDYEDGYDDQLGNYNDYD